jgi:hypothetical protein
MYNGMESSGICKPAELQYGLGTLDTVEDVSSKIKQTT